MNRIASIGRVVERRVSAVHYLADYLALTKPRLVGMVLLSTMVGFYLGVRNGVVPIQFLITLVATAFVASGSMVFNQLFECETDRKMYRTQNRPLPAGRLERTEAFLFGLILSLAGFFIFTICLAKVSAVFAFVTWASYLFVYTPLKTKTSFSTIVGAFPGALPPIIGWAAATGAVGFQALILFLIIFFWQLPHFLAIAWMYREDYERARIPVLSVIDREGAFVARQMLLNVCALMPVSLLPTLFALTGATYFFGAFGLGICFAVSIIFAAANLDVRARYVLRASIVYLAALLLLMVIDKL